MMVVWLVQGFLAWTRPSPVAANLGFLMEFYKMEQRYLFAIGV
jgi:hypothetical protein